MLQARTRRLTTAVALLGATAALTAGCTWGRRPPTTPTTTPPTTVAPTTTMPGHGGDGHGGDDHGGGSHTIPDRLNHPPTPAQKAAADELVRKNREINATRFATTVQAEAAGYIGIGDDGSGVIHYEHPTFRRDGKELDLNFPEALVYKTSTRRLQTVMYILEPGKTMNDVPDIAGNLTRWHDHGNLCWKSENPDDPNYLKLSGAALNGRCFPSGYLRIEPPMLHVWIVDNPCGPFAGTDPLRSTGSCVQH